MPQDDLELLYSMAVDADPDWFEHHGKLGMRWGKRNGPPYPLDAEGKAALRKQKKEEKDQNYRDRESDKIKKRYTKAANQYNKKFQKNFDKMKKQSAKGKDTSKTERKMYNALSGQNYTHNLMKAELGKIKIMDISEDKRKKGAYYTKQVLKTAAIAGASRAITGGQWLVFTYGGAPYSRLSKQDRNEIKIKSDKQMSRAYEFAKIASDGYDPKYVINKKKPK